jgi:membrane protease YdiL (CAAX protease family)
MTVLTLTPDTRVYVVALIAVWAPACAPVAALVQSAWPAQRRPSFMPLYLATMAAVGGIALATLDLSAVAHGDPRLLALSAAAGLAAASAAIWADRAVRRRAGERVTPRPGAVHATGLPLSTRSDLLLLLAVAALEELLFRGVLVALSLQLPLAPAVACIALSVVAFAAAHAQWGVVEMLAKLPLGVAALAASLPFGTLLGAVVTHAVFNLRAWLAWRSAA